METVLKRLLAAGCILFWTMETPLYAGEIKPSNSSLPECCKTITYSTNPQYPPYDWSVDSDRFDGASIELLSLAVPPGITLRPVVYPWKRSLYLAKEGEIDLLVSLRITPERSEYLRFTTHRAFPNPIVIFIRKDRKFPYKSWADLKTHRGGIALGDTFGASFDKYWRKELQVEEAPSMLENFQKLDAGRIDYFVSSYYLGQAYLASHKPKHMIIALTPPISNQDIYFGFSRRSPCTELVDYVSKRLEELDHQGVSERLLKKYLRRFTRHPVELFPR